MVGEVYFNKGAEAEIASRQVRKNGPVPTAVQNSTVEKAT
jgi:hypothetical protein